MKSSYSKAGVRKLIFHFDTPFGNEVDEDVAKDIESFRNMCKGRIGFSNNGIYDRKRLEVSCEEEPQLIELNE